MNLVISVAYYSHSNINPLAQLLKFNEVFLYNFTKKSPFLSEKGGVGGRK